MSPSPTNRSKPKSTTVTATNGQHTHRTTSSKDGSKAASSSHPPPRLQLQLETIIGHTILNNNHLAINTHSGEVAYIAGNLLVFYHPTTHVQSRYAVARDGHTLSAITYSPDGKYLAIGDSGKQPVVSIYATQSSSAADSSDNSAASQNEPISIIPTKSIHSISSLRWSPNNQWLLVAGSEHDRQLAVYTQLLPAVKDDSASFAFHPKQPSTDTEQPVWQVTTDNVVNAIDIADDSTYFLCAGTKLVQTYQVTASTEAVTPTFTIAPPATAKLGVHQEAAFSAVVCGVGAVQGKFYALTSKGVLCCFKKKAVLNGVTPAFTYELDKWVDLRLNPGLTLCMPSANMIGISGGDSKVRLFEAEKLTHIATLPKPVTPATSTAATAKSPTCIALQITPDLSKALCVYNDHQFIVWDIRNIPQRAVTMHRTLSGHHGTIWDVMYLTADSSKHKSLTDGLSNDENTDPNTASQPSLYPANSFVTCSSDNTLRLWNLDIPASTSQKTSHEHLRALHTLIPPSNASQKDSDYGVRCMSAINSSVIACGDRYGNLRIQSLQQSASAADHTLLTIAAHNKEIRALDYHSQSARLVSGSRDTMIHTYDFSNSTFTSNDMKQPTIKTLPPTHSAAITSVKVSTTVNGVPKIISTSSDKSIVFRSLNNTSDDAAPHETVLQTKSTVHDLTLHPNGRTALCVSADKSIRILDIINEKPTRMYRLSCRSNNAEPVRCQIDSSGNLVAISTHPDKYVHILDFYSGQCLTHTYCPSMKFTFSPDSNRLLCVNDSTIVAYRVSRNLKDDGSNGNGSVTSRATSVEGSGRSVSVPAPVSGQIQQSLFAQQRRSSDVPLTARRVTRTALDFLNESDDEDSVDTVHDEPAQQALDPAHQVEIDTSDSESESETDTDHRKVQPTSVSEVKQPVSTDERDVQLSPAASSPFASAANLSAIQLSPIVPHSAVQAQLHQPVSSDSPTSASSSKSALSAINNSALPAWAQSTMVAPGSAPAADQQPSEANDSQQSLNKGKGKWQNRLPDNGFMIASDLTQRGNVHIQLQPFNTATSTDEPGLGDTNAQSQKLELIEADDVQVDLDDDHDSDDERVLTDEGTQLPHALRQSVTNDFLASIRLQPQTMLSPPKRNVLIVPDSPSISSATTPTNATKAQQPTSDDATVAPAPAATVQPTSTSKPAASGPPPLPSRPTQKPSMSSFAAFGLPATAVPPSLSRFTSQTVIATPTPSIAADSAAAKLQVATNDGAAVQVAPATSREADEPLDHTLAAETALQAESSVQDVTTASEQQSNPPSSDEQEALMASGDTIKSPAPVIISPPTLQASASPHTSPSSRFKQHWNDSSSTVAAGNTSERSATASELPTQQHSYKPDVATYKHTLNQLQQSVRQSISMFQQLKAQPMPTAQRANSSTDRANSSDELTTIADEYEDQLLELRAQLDSVLASTSRAKTQQQTNTQLPPIAPSSAFAHMRKPSSTLDYQQQTMLAMQLPSANNTGGANSMTLLSSIDFQSSLDRYSDMLLQAVMQKLEAKTAQ